MTRHEGPVPCYVRSINDIPRAVNRPARIVPYAFIVLVRVCSTSEGRLNDSTAHG
jgi:hypothetical protein